MSASDEQLIRRPAGSRNGIYVAVGVLAIVSIVIVVGWQMGWLSPKANPNPAVVPPGSCTPPNPVAISGAGSTFVYPLMVTWEGRYHHSTIAYGSVGSGTGISNLNSKIVDFAASDAPLSPAQQALLPGGVITIPETAGAVSIIYNLPGVASNVNFTGTILANIFLGAITSWDDPQLLAANPNVALPSQPMTPVHRLDGSGTTFAFTDYLSKSSGTWANQIGKATTVTWPSGVGLQQKGSGGVANYILTTPYTIGYVDLSYALTNGIAYGAVKNPAGNNILPTLNDSRAAVINGASSLPAGNSMPDWYNVSLVNEPGAGDYPITTFSYLMVYGSLDGVYGSGFDLNKAENLVNFLNWTVTYGQSDSGTLYYVPLPDTVVAASQASLKLITYGGQPVPICTAA